MRFELHPRQTEAFLSLATEILYGGAAGGGKSHLMRVAAIAWCMLIGGLQVYIFRRTSPDLIKNHMEGPTGFPMLLAKLVEGKYVRINHSDNSISFWNGSKIFLCHCQYPQDVYKYQGAEIHVLIIDELTHFLESMYRFLRGRVRMTGIILPVELEGRFPRVLCGSNPGGIGHTWVKQTFIDGASPMEIRHMPKEEGGMKRQYIPAKLDDNPTLAEGDPDYISRLEGLASAELVKAMRDGDWNIVAGGAFDDVWREDVHVIEAFPIPETWRIDRSFDWGSSKPFSVGWWAESDGSQAPNGKHYPKGTLFRIAEYYGWNGKADTGCKMLSGDIAKEILRLEEEFFPGRTVEPGPADSAIYDASDGKSIADKMEEVGVYWEPADKRPGSRIAGFEQIRGMLKASCSTPMEEPGMFAFERCHHFKRTVPVLPRDPNKPDDVDTKAEDHVCDETRYRAMAIRHAAFGFSR